MFAKSLSQPHTDPPLIDILRLIRSENIGQKTFVDLLRLCGTPARALEQAPELSRRGGKSSPIKICSLNQAEQELEACRKIGAEIISYQHPLYPKLLRQISDFPPILTIHGNKEILDSKKIAIVGSRNASANGCRFAEKLTTDLGKAGVTIVSGLARGIDTFAHRGALDTGTIGVIAGGINNIYPPENKPLYEQIPEKGLIIAELPFGSIPRGQNFPQRNRIISGLSLGVAIIEASFGSGSLITARMAASQNRDVFAVPGFPLDPRCQGTNSLIKQGAKLLESYQDILDELEEHYIAKNLFDHSNDFMAPPLPLAGAPELQKARIDIKNLLSSSPIFIDDVVKLGNFNISVVLTVILELELAGKLTRHHGNKISLNYL